MPMSVETSTITIPASDGSGSFSAYVARPAGEARHGAVVMIQEIFGVNAAMRALCGWVADMGFVAVCPDLFWRQQPGVELTDGSKEEWDRAFALMNGFDQDKGVEDLKATLVHARTMPGGNGRAGTMGFCLGGRMAVLMAIKSDSDVNVSYYGVGLDGLTGQADEVDTPLLMHVAGADKFVPPPAQAAIEEGFGRNPNVTVHSYPGKDHAFARMGGHSWDGLAATIANGRTAELLDRTLNG
ncbi:dienelactone hydrolase family protein [Roseomonas sp. CCTCC AB2023176]|uniref:dienelactone hydrolase family protein n=1 Tax=Roseomonas sp. CCTCC AB2023176 TaxID=3342640 RepID=UPI0035E2F9C8